MDIVTLKRSIVKLDSFLVDIHDMLDDDNNTESDRDDLNIIADIGTTVMDNMVNKVKCLYGDCDDLLNDTDSLEFDEYPELDSVVDIMDTTLED